MKKYFVLLVAVILGIFACTKFDDLSKSSVNLLSPAKNEKDSILSKIFWWDVVTNATKYELQIVSPSFDSIATLVLDSTVTTNQFKYTLTPGKYQWRVRAENNDSKSPWTTYSLIIGNTQSLTGQTVEGMSPASGKDSDSLLIHFKWNALGNAQSYLLTITNTTTNANVLTQSLSTTSFDYTFKAEGNYTWAVQGVNITSVSLSSQNTLVVDTTRPVVLSMIFPASITDTMKPPYNKPFSWSINSTTPVGSAIQDSIWVSSDSTFKTKIVLSKVVSGVTTLTVDTLATAAGKLYWRVRLKDDAGNVGPYSKSTSLIKK